MTAIIALLMLILAFGSTLMAVTSVTTERLLWGSLLASIGQGLAVQLLGGGYYGLLMVAVFIVTDLTLYLFFRSQKLLPAGPPRHERGDRLFRVFVLWLSFCAIAGTVAVAFSLPADDIWSNPSNVGVGLLHERIWAADWLMVVLAVLSLVILVTGGFFLVRKEQ